MLTEHGILSINFQLAFASEGSYGKYVLQQKQWSLTGAFDSSKHHKQPNK